MTDKTLITTFKAMHQALTPEQLGAVNVLRLELYVEADRLRDKCRITRGIHPADADLIRTWQKNQRIFYYE